MMLAREGARVICADRVLASAEETVDLIRAEGGEAHPVHLDITNAAAVTAGVEHALQLLGRLDVVVNNVGIGGRGDGPAHRVDEAAFDRILQVNLSPRRTTASAATQSSQACSTRRWPSPASHGCSAAPRTRFASNATDRSLGGDMGTAWDTAYAVLYLASDEARFVSGAILPVDGAMGVTQATGT